ncbi:MAG: ABC transporter permease [Candidatus Helarchaeota archaeon]
MEETLLDRTKHLISSVWAITERQLLRIIRHKVILVGQFGLPILLLIAFGFGLDSLLPGLFDYLVAGVMIMSVFFASQFSAFAIVNDREIGFQEEILVSSAPRIAIILGNSLSGAFRAFYQGIGVLVTGLLMAIFVKRGTMLFVTPLGALGIFISIIGLSVTIVFASLFVGGFMSLLSSLFRDSETYFLVTSIIAMPLFFTSDVIFPDNLAIVGLPLFNMHTLNPLNIATNALRFWLLPGSSWPIGFTFPILIILGIVFTIASTWLFQVTARQ